MAFLKKKKILFALNSFVGSLKKKPNGVKDIFKQISYLKLQTVFCSHSSRVLWFEQDDKIMQIQSRKEKKVHQKLLI